jgi:hypothetical protein
MGKARSARAVWRANRPPAIAAVLMALQVSRRLCYVVIPRV